ncbi:protein NUCLEAR FUSION DEFECTIVE 4-like [Telopea speciosissima]|uniref:protein NUCLEAR FUSION DEFECTIVE 4-like n=1 Tax=Telopea speciosissima TaxID=54955 RepID=UPI001CC60872|nr:protein NUCLEAR FUSION DEFECTIVE 4-like [Telopea speciosissima]
MAGQSRKWMILVATIWIQAFTGTNFDFSAYSTDLKSILGISQVQLNYLAVASDLGKAFGWSSGLALLYLPLWVVMFMAASMGIVGYGVQWAVIQNLISLPYVVVFLMCLIAGCSICWFNTVCFVLCVRNFPSNRALALSLTISFNGVSPALYTLAANSINSDDDSVYLLLNAIIPLITSFAALLPILRQPSVDTPLLQEAVRRDSLIFLFLNFLAIFTGLYLLLLNSISSDVWTNRFLFAGAILLLILPLCVPGGAIARDWAHRNIHSSFRLEGSTFSLVDPDDLELHKELLGRESISSLANGVASNFAADPNRTTISSSDGISSSRQSLGECIGYCDKVVFKDQLMMLGEEHSATMLIRRLDFWLYYLAYFCGGTIGLVYSNNLGQIAQSLGFSSETTTLVTLYSSFSFFGRLLSATPDFIRWAVYFARTGWLSIALVPTPIAFCVLALSGSSAALHVGTALIGLSSGFIFAAAVSITSELFGPSSMGVNHNILITNIPLGSLAYGLLAAIVYDANVNPTLRRLVNLDEEAMVCMGRQCYHETFVWWACISMLGLVSSVFLFIRTRPAYDHFEQNRKRLVNY